MGKGEREALRWGGGPCAGSGECHQRPPHPVPPGPPTPWGRDKGQTFAPPARPGEDLQRPQFRQPRRVGVMPVTRRHEGVAGVVEEGRDFGVGFGDRRDVGGQNQLVGLAEVQDGRTLGRLVQMADDVAAIEAGDGRHAAASAGRQPGRRAAKAEAHDEDRPLQGVDRRLDVRRGGVAPAGGLRIGELGVAAGGVDILVGEAAALAGEEVGDQDLIAVLGPLLRQPAQVRGHAPDGVQDDQAATPRVCWNGMPGLKLKAVRRRQGDGLSHQTLSNSSRVRRRARSAASWL